MQKEIEIIIKLFLVETRCVLNQFFKTFTMSGPSYILDFSKAQTMTSIDQVIRKAVGVSLEDYKSIYPEKFSFWESMEGFNHAYNNMTGEKCQAICTSCIAKEKKTQ